MSLATLPDSVPSLRTSGKIAHCAATHTCERLQCQAGLARQYRTCKRRTALPAWPGNPSTAVAYYWNTFYQDSPWYPGVMRLFRHTASHYWLGVVKELELSSGPIGGAFDS